MLSLLVAFFLAAPPQQAPPVRARLPQAPPVREAVKAPCLCQATGECACKVCTCQKAKSSTVPPVQLTAKAPENPYAKARASALANNHPLVVFVGVVRPERIEGMDVVSLTTSQWAEYSGELENAIIVCVPANGDLKRFVKPLPVTATETQIRAEVESAKIAARPQVFYQMQQPAFFFAGCST